MSFDQLEIAVALLKLAEKEIATDSEREAYQTVIESLSKAVMHEQLSKTLWLAFSPWVYPKPHKA